MIAVLVLLGVTRLFRSDEIKCQISFEVSWLCLVGSIAFLAAQQLSIISIESVSNDKISIFIGGFALVALGGALLFWYFALTSNPNQNQA